MKHKTAPKIFVVFIILFVVATLNTIKAQNSLESPNYRILDPNINSGGGTSQGTGYDLLSNAGQVGADTRLDSANYRLRSGFPNSFQANVPLINCFETTSTSGTTSCDSLPNLNGLDGECGEGGCYNRAKIEIDNQNNPIDTLYLVALSPDNWVTTYYLQSDHSISTSFDINDYMTRCAIEGKDVNDTNCDNNGDSGWNASLQSTNIFSLEPNRTYQAKVRAVSGDFTETQFSPIINAVTQDPSISFDVDLASSDINTSAPHNITLGTLAPNTITTATNSIWIDVGTNAVNGINIYVNNLGNGLYSGPSAFIPSEAEDLSTPDGDGGYGLKNVSVAQASLGPLISNPTYNTGSAEQVGALSGTPAVIFSTNSIGPNKGPIFGGRGRTNLKVRTYFDLASGNYSDTITFTVLGNW